MIQNAELKSYDSKIQTNNSPVTDSQKISELVAFDLWKLCEDFFSRNFLLILISHSLEKCRKTVRKTVTLRPMTRRTM
jgi:hypothetical protein